MLLGRLVLAATVFSACMTSTSAFAQGSLQDQLAVCARIAKKGARIECYDSIARANPQGASTSSLDGSATLAPREQSLPPTNSQSARSADFGAEQIDRPLERRPEDDQKELDVVVASSRDNGLNMWTINLADGNVWRMTERVSEFRPPVSQERVTIRKAALGSYLMQVGKQAAVRVQRVR